MIRLQNLYGERGGLVTGDLPDWLLDFTTSLSPQPRAWIDAYVQRSPPADEKANALALEMGATKWAADLTPTVSALALTFVLIACAEPQIAAQLTERVLQAIEEQAKARPHPSAGFLLLKGVAANALGTLLAGLGRHEEAVRWLTTAVALAHTADDDDTGDRFRGNLAHSLEMLGQIAEARTAYQTTLAGYRRRGDPAPLAFGLTGLASHLIRQFHLDEARGAAEEAIQWATKAGDERLRGTALNDLGMIAKLKGDYPTALKIFADVEALFTRLGNDEAVAAAAGNRGEVLAALGQLDEAERIHRAVLQIHERLERRDNQGATCLSLGTLARQRGDLVGAQSWFTQAFDIFSAIKDPSNEALALSRLASIKTQAGRFEDAIVLAESALPRVSERNAAFTSDLWNQIGLANFNLGRVGRAEEAYRKVYGFTKALGATRPQASAAMNLGTALLLQQRDDEAAAFFAESAVFWEQLGEAANRDYCQRGEAAVRLDQKIAALSDAGHAARDPDEQRATAREMVALYPELIAQYEAIGAMQLVAAFCASAASTAAFAGDVGKAVAWYRRAAKVYQDLGLASNARPPLERCEELLRRWTNALMQKPDMAAALPELRQLAEVASELGHRGHCASSLLNAAIALLQTSQQFAEARGLAEQALGLFAADSDDAAMARKVIAYCTSQIKSG